MKCEVTHHIHMFLSHIKSKFEITLTFTFILILYFYFLEALKILINEKRPDGSLETDPGMPSSHALSNLIVL